MWIRTLRTEEHFEKQRQIKRGREVGRGRCLLCHRIVQANEKGERQPTRRQKNGCVNVAVRVRVYVT